MKKDIVKEIKKKGYGDTVKIIDGMNALCYYCLVSPYEHRKAICFSDCREEKCCEVFCCVCYSCADRIKVIL